MAALDTALAELEGSLNNPGGAGKAGADLAKFIIESRSRTIVRITDVVQSAAADPRLKADPDLARQFNDKLQGLRRNAAAIQAKWRAADIETNFAEYAPQSRATAAAMVDFCRWARASL